MKRMHSSPYKKPKLDIQCSQAQSSIYNNDVRDDISTYWGEDFSFDAVEEIQQQETEALTQFSLQGSRVISNTTLTSAHENYKVSVERTSINIDDDKNEWKEQLLTKDGEISILRRELDEIRKKHANEIQKLNSKVRHLEKETAAKDAAIKFQEQQMLLLEQKKKLNTTQVKPIKDTSPTQHSKRFSFGETSIQIKNNESAEKLFFSHEGELFHNLLAPTLTQIPQVSIDAHTQGDTHLRLDPDLTDNKFISCFGMDLIALFRFSSFKDKPALDIISKIITKSYKEFYTLFFNIRQMKLRQCNNMLNQMIQESTRYKIDPLYEYSLLSNSKWYPDESCVYLRQTLTMLSILLCINTSTVKLLTEQDQVHKCCNIEDMDKLLDSSRSSHFTDIDDICIRNENILKEDSSSQNSTRLQTAANLKNTICIFTLLCQIIFILSNQNQIVFHLGLVAAVINFYETICRCVPSIVDKIHEMIISSSLRQIILNTREPVLICYIARFLNRSVSMCVNITQNLCHKSAADTFVEDSVCYSYTTKTCALQVFCVGIEMMPYSVEFIHSFLSWAATFTSGEYGSNNWLQNRTDAKLCECLPSFEQTLIKVFCNCVLQFKNPELTCNDRKLLKSNLRLSWTIFMRLKHHDEDFDIHISRYQGQYVQFLNDLRIIFHDDNDFVEFIVEELKRTAFADISPSSSILESNEFNLDDISAINEIKNEINESLFNRESLFANKKHFTSSYEPDGEEGMQVDKSDNETDETEKLSVKDYLQSTLTQSYFTG